VKLSKNDQIRIMRGFRKPCKAMADRRSELTHQWWGKRLGREGDLAAEGKG